MSIATSFSTDDIVVRHTAILLYTYTRYNRYMIPVVDEFFVRSPPCTSTALSLGQTTTMMLHACRRQIVFELRMFTGYGISCSDHVTLGRRRIRFVQQQ